MACVEQVNQELIHKANISIAHAKNALELIQAKMLARGASSFKHFQRRFLIMDDDRSKKLSFEEFKTGLKDIGVNVPDDKLMEAFRAFDKDGSNNIDMNEFVQTLSPKMNAARKDLVLQCFLLMDKTGDRVITVKDLIGSYNVSKHPKYLSGEWTETKVYKEFLKTFEAEGHEDGNVTCEDFMLYYASLSASIDNDAYFRLMMRNSWKHLDKDGKIF